MIILNKKMLTMAKLCVIITKEWVRGGVHMYTMSQDVINAIAAVVLGATIIGAIIYIALYVFESLGLMHLAKRNNIKNSWIAFIPVANVYIYGKLAFEDNVKTGVLLGFKVLSTFSLVGNFFRTINSVNNYTTFTHVNDTMLSVFSFLYVIYLFYATYLIFKKYSDKAILMLVFSILSCGFLVPIFIFAIRNNECKSV